MCGICMALMLAGCGDAEEEKVQIVEREDIADQEAKQEDTGAPEEDAQEKPEESDVPEETAPEDGSTGDAGGKPAVVTIEEEKQEYTEGEVLIMTTVYDHVTVAVEGNEAATQAIAETFEERAQAFQESIADSVEWAKQDTLVTDSGMSYSEEREYAVARNDGRILSFAYSSSGFEGGAHGYYMEYGLNFDAETGQVLTIADIAQDEAAFQDICVQEMLRQCADLKAQGLLFDEEILQTAATGGLQGIMESKMEGEEWYFTEKGIRFISNIYEIAPYAAGNFMFDIPYEMINETLKEEYRGTGSDSRAAQSE